MFFALTRVNLPTSHSAPSAHAHARGGGGLQGDTRLSYDPNDPKYWLPPYEHGGAHAREQSRMVSSRRTPSGNFFNITNPSLHMDRVPSTNKPPPGYKVEIDTLVATKRANEIAEEKAKRDAKNAAIDAQIAAKKGETSDVPPWAGNVRPLTPPRL